VRGPGSLRGEHNYEALTEWLGVPNEAIKSLHSQGVLMADKGAIAP
jgi:hypothetical protein